jgi:hypothetical protein
MGQPAARERERVYMERCSVAEWEDWRDWTGGGYKRASQPHMSPDFVFFFFSFLVVVTFSD